jgi:hypothetical protein
MLTIHKLYFASMLAATAIGPFRAMAADAPKPPPVVQSFAALGPATPADLAHLREALEKAPGAVTVEVRPAPGGALIAVKGDVLFTILAAAARPLGYRMEQLAVRWYAADGPAGDADLARLREALQAAPGVEGAALGKDEAGLAVRVTGIAPTSVVAKAAKSAGFTLRQLGAYAASGPGTVDQLKRLRTALTAVPEVEKVEMQDLLGGATLLIQGDVAETKLTAAARSAGYTLAALRNAPGRKAEFAIGAKPGSTVDEQKVREFAEGLEGVEAAEIRSTLEGKQLALTGDRLKPDRIVAAAAEAGIELRVVENVTLPSLAPKAGRVTPASYEDAIVEDPIEPGKPAPQFTLLSQDGVRKISLGDFTGAKPLVLIFGSCT